MLKILALGAHPDDCDFVAGGCAALWTRRGDEILFVSVTNGDAGHSTMSPEALTERRRAEARAAGAVIGIEYEVLSHRDGQLLPSLENRLDMIRRIRRFAPDLILTHRPNDYHPDHRYTSMLVQDSAYMVTVPLLCPDTPHLQTNPVIAYFHDDFTKPCPFEAHVVIDVDAVMEEKWRMLHAHTSQFYEWLPVNDGTDAEVPAGAAERRTWLEKRWGPRLEEVARRYRARLVETYGLEPASRVRFAEAFEVSEYGTRPTPERVRELFPFPG
ncbi:MAG TPA: PIG-L deacetylase family protein [Planctomycetota bacterium]|nr:PIG-L deacetylase family protein [Planctomycetota bacterium]